VEATFDCSLFRADGSAVPGASGGLETSVVSSVPRWLTPDAAWPGSVAVASSGWFVRWGYQRAQLVRRVALGAEAAHSGCTFELRGCADRAFGSTTLVASATTVGTARAPVWTDASYVMPFTHFELRHSGGAAQAGAFLVALGE
jgi:hypothetical protein